jgi:Na+/H+-dicarboxylate symporter
VYGLLSLVLISRYNPLRHFAQFAPAYSISFGSASSASTLPTTMKCAEDAGLTETIYQFVLSLGATVNMDGNSIFYPVWL